MLRPTKKNPWYLFPALLLWSSTSLLAETPIHTVSSPHYVLHWEGAEEQAEEMSRVLEAAWVGFERFFNARPRLNKSERLTVRFFQNRERWAKSIKDDGTVPPSKGGGYYWPGSKTAYLYRQPTPYYTRALLIHETCHQFHYLSRTGNRGPRANWYVEGVVEHLAWHTWDGESLALGQVPISLKDYPANALASLVKGETNLKSLVANGSNRPLGAMLVRYLVLGEKGRLRPRYEKLAKAYDRGRGSAPAFKSIIGDPDQIQIRFRAWLEKNQEPWGQIFNFWERIGPARFQGTATGVSSASRIKEPAESLHATLEVPPDGAWKGGLLLEYVDSKHYTMALASNAQKLSVERYEKGRWKSLASRALPLPEKEGCLRFSARRDGGEVVLSVEGKEMGRFRLAGSTLGLAARCCTVRFRDVSWKLAPK